MLSWYVFLSELSPTLSCLSVMKSTLQNNGCILFYIILCPFLSNSTDTAIIVVTEAHRYKNHFSALISTVNIQVVDACRDHWSLRSLPWYLEFTHSKTHIKTLLSLSWPKSDQLHHSDNNCQHLTATGMKKC